MNIYTFSLSHSRPSPFISSFLSISWVPQNDTHYTLIHSKYKPTNLSIEMSSVSVPKILWPLLYFAGTPILNRGPHNNLKLWRWKIPLPPNGFLKHSKIAQVKDTPFMGFTKCSKNCSNSLALFVRRSLTVREFLYLYRSNFINNSLTHAVCILLIFTVTSEKNN